MIKKGLLLSAFIVLCVAFGYAQQQPAHIQSTFNEGLRHVHMLFDGQWLPNVEPELIGAQNFKSLKNMRYTDGGIEGINGCSKINTAIINASYYKPRSGHHFRKDRPSESHLLLQTYNHDGTLSRVYQNKTVIPNVGNFEPVAIHDDESYGTFTGSYGHNLAWVTDLSSSGVTHAVVVGALSSSGAIHAIAAYPITMTAVVTAETPRSRFCKGPNGTVIYSNGVKSQIWGGDSSRVAAFIASDRRVTEYATNGKDFSEEVNNEYQTTAESAGVSGYLSGGTAYFLIGAPRPISGVSFMVSSANPLSGKTVYIQEWNGAWTDLAVSDGTNGLRQNGKVSFPSTVATSKPKYLENGLFYWYQGRVEGGASIYNVALDIPWQNLVDLWDNVYRTPISFQAKKGSDYKDWTLEVNQGSIEEYPIGAKIGGLGTNDEIIVMFEDRMQAVRLEMLSGNTAAFTGGVALDTWSGSAWAESGVTYDSTADISGITPFSRSGYLTWQPPNHEAEFEQTLFGLKGFAYRIRLKGTLGGTGATEDMVIVDLAYGVPAPLKLQNYKFAAFYKNRTYLLGYLKGNTPNRIDYCKSNAPDCWNGEETSNNRKFGGPLYAGGGEELTGAISIYNRYGADLYNNLLLLKRNEIYVLSGDGPENFKIDTISENVGCPAPYTITSAEIGYEMVKDELQRNVVMWLAGTGPYLFDGSVLMPMRGIENFFDQNDDEYVGIANIADAFAWYDPNYKEWHLRVGDYWFVYDFVRRRWYQRDTGVAEKPQCAFQVTDTNGAKHVYAGFDDGFMKRLEHGYSWDGTAIAQEVETGDFYLDNDAWHQTILRRLKVVSKVISEDATVQVTHYKDTATSGTSVMSIPLSSGLNSVGKVSRPLNQQAWMHRLRFATETDETNKGLQLLGWGYQYGILREDE